jgi:hypothetical protein
LLQPILYTRFHDAELVLYAFLIPKIMSSSASTDAHIHLKGDDNLDNRAMDVVKGVLSRRFNMQNLLVESPLFYVHDGNNDPVVLPKFPGRSVVRT